MLKLIIADDERIIRESISSLIDWNSLNIQLIGTCKNGLEAYHMILEKHPDIVLTDIKMPGMSGLELPEKIAEEQMIVEFIILTGYEDFNFAREAIQHKIHHYLLKPCNEDQIIQAVKDASVEVLRRRQIRQLLADSPAAASSPSNYSDYIVKTIHYIEQNYSSPTLSLKELSETILFMNPDYVSRQFFLQIGSKFSDYLTDYRIKRAKWLLLYGNEDISSVAEKVGYSNNPQYFSHLFKKITGMSLKSYIKEMRDT